MIAFEFAAYDCQIQFIAKDRIEVCDELFNGPGITLAQSGP